MTSPAYASIGRWLESLDGDKRVDDITRADIERLCADLNGVMVERAAFRAVSAIAAHSLALGADHQCDENCCTDYGQVPNENRRTK